MRISALLALLPAVKTNNQIDSDVDYALTDKDRLRFRFSFGRPVTFQAPLFGDAGGYNSSTSGFEGTGQPCSQLAGKTFGVSQWSAPVS